MYGGKHVEFWAVGEYVYNLEGKGSNAWNPRECQVSSGGLIRPSSAEKSLFGDS